MLPRSGSVLSQSPFASFGRRKDFPGRPAGRTIPDDRTRAPAKRNRAEIHDSSSTEIDAAGWTSPMSRSRRGAAMPLPIV